MTNFGAKILNNATTALSAQQAVIATIGNNIANANTAGYARRVVDLQTRVSNAAPGTLNVGNGVEIGGLIRVADNFVETLLRDATSAKGRSDIELEMLKRIEGLFTVSGQQNTIGSTFTSFFNALNDLTADPASIELRANVMQRAEDLVTTIRNTYNELANLQTEADNRLTSEILNVNNITSRIAELNGLISQRETSGVAAADERDQRDVLMKQLAEKISYEVVETGEGSVTITLPSGFPLVNGTNYREISLTNQPSFAPGLMPVSLEGGILRHIVYDYDPSGTNAHLDLTQQLKEGDGSIAGLLRLRGYNDPANGALPLSEQAFNADGIIVEMASRVESITRTLLTQFNQVYRGPDENGGAAGHQPSSGNLNGTSPSVFGLFDFNYTLGLKDNDGDGVAEATDLAALTTGNYSSIFQLAFTDPRLLAAARDSDAAAGATSFQPGDGRNIEALVAMQTSTYTFTTGSFTTTTTFDGVYNQAVTHVGNAKSSASLDNSVTSANLVTMQSRRDSVSGVSLDEEFTSLIKFQKAYQASARMIRTATELLDEIIGLL